MKRSCPLNISEFCELFISEASSFLHQPAKSDFIEKTAFRRFFLVHTAGVEPAPEDKNLNLAGQPIPPRVHYYKSVKLVKNLNLAFAVRNIVALLRLERSHRSVFLPLKDLPSSATGSGKPFRPIPPRVHFNE